MILKTIWRLGSPVFYEQTCTARLLHNKLIIAVCLPDQILYSNSVQPDILAPEGHFFGAWMSSTIYRGSTDDC